MKALPLSVFLQIKTLDILVRESDYVLHCAGKLFLTNSFGRKFLEANVPWDKSSLGQKFRGAKIPWGESSVGRKFRGAKVPWGESSPHPSIHLAARALFHKSVELSSTSAVCQKVDVRFTSTLPSKSCLVRVVECELLSAS